MVVFKNSQDCDLILSDPKFLQSKVNKVMRKSVKFTSNPFADENEEESEDEMSPEQQAEKEHKAKMEDGGFIMVVPETLSGKKGRGTDGVSTVQGIS